MLRKEVLNTIMNDRDYQDISGYEAIIDNYLIATAAQGRNYCTFNLIDELPDKDSEDIHYKINLLAKEYEKNGIFITRIADKSYMIDWADKEDPNATNENTYIDSIMTDKTLSEICDNLNATKKYFIIITILSVISIILNLIK